MKLHTVALPFGVLLFLAGLLYAGLPTKTHIAWGIDFGLSSEVRMLAGLISFGLGSFLMWMGKGEEKRFFDNVQIESGEIKRILSERKRRE